MDQQPGGWHRPFNSFAADNRLVAPQARSSFTYRASCEHVLFCSQPRDVEHNTDASSGIESSSKLPNRTLRRNELLKFISKYRKSSSVRWGPDHDLARVGANCRGADGQRPPRHICLRCELCKCAVFAFTLGVVCGHLQTWLHSQFSKACSPLGLIFKLKRGASAMTTGEVDGTDIMPAGA